MVEDFNISPILEETKKRFKKFDIIFHNINITKYEKGFIEKKILGYY